MDPEQLRKLIHGIKYSLVNKTFLIRYMPIWSVPEERQEPFSEEERFMRAYSEIDSSLSETEKSEYLKIWNEYLQAIHDYRKETI